MANFRIGIIVVALVTLIIGGILLAIPKQKSLEETIIAQATGIPVNEAIPEESNYVMTIAEVINPFQNDGSYPVSYSIQGDSNSVGAVSSKTSYIVDVNTPELILPAADQFEQVGVNAANVTENGTIIIAHEYIFMGDAIITWNNGSSIENTNSWNPHPNTIPVTQGQQVTVTYTSKDGGNTWIGNILS
jgi:hypothetical protein